MRVSRRLTIISVLWTILVLIIATKTVKVVVGNAYFEKGLLHCAIAGYVEDLHWASFLFILACAGVLVLTFILRVVSRDALLRLIISIKAFLFLFIAYLVIVYMNTKSWYPEFYTARGTIYNGLVLVAVLAGVVFLPLRQRGISWLVDKVGLRIPAGIFLLFYVLPFLFHSFSHTDHTTNVLFITVDTLRADHLSMNGYSRETSKNIDAFSRGCRVFQNAYSQSSFTPPSHASMFTSRLVSSHRLYAWERLSDKEVTLAEVLSNEGYETAAFVNMSLLSEQNLGQGFQTKVESFLNIGNCLSEKLAYTMKKKAVEFYNGHEINRMFLKWLARRGTRPFFVWLHYWDVHRPYARDEKYEAMYSEGSAVSKKVGRELWHYNLTEDRMQNLGFGGPELDYIYDRYDAGIYMFDRMFQQLLDGLKELGVFDNTLIVLTSDHGESLLERDEMFFAHDPFLYNEVIKVPLLISVPGHRDQGKVSEPVMLVDIYPSILRLLGIEKRYDLASDGIAFNLDGRSETSGGARDILSECFGWRYKRAIIVDNVKYIYDFEKNACEIYDLVKDGEEKVMLDHGPQGTAITGMMNRYNNDFMEDLKARLMDHDQYERLKALGYVEE
jgi:arylsulfatase